MLDRDVVEEFLDCQFKDIELEILTGGGQGRGFKADEKHGYC